MSARAAHTLTTLSAWLLAATAAASASAPELAPIAIDVGHSLDRPGATSARGVPEFRFNQALALAVNKTLRARGLRTLLIGEDGDAHELSARTAAATQAGARFFLSVHHDSVQPQYLESWSVDGREQRYADRFSGFSLFVSRRNPDPERSLACARAIGAALRGRGFRPSLHHAEPIPGENRPLADAENGVYWFDGLLVLRTAASPAVLLEAGIIVNRSEEMDLTRPATRERIADALADGLRRCLR
jgi:N-acetylmuramoyl-L-alanine amidase